MDADERSAEVGRQQEIQRGLNEKIAHVNARIKAMAAEMPSPLAAMLVLVEKAQLGAELAISQNTLTMLLLTEIGERLDAVEERQSELDG